LIEVGPLLAEHDDRGGEALGGGDLDLHAGGGEALVGAGHAGHEVVDRRGR
jgi:hypothetical protein